MPWGSTLPKERSEASTKTRVAWIALAALLVIIVAGVITTYFLLAITLTN